MGTNRPQHRAECDKYRRSDRATSHRPHNVQSQAISRRCHRRSSEGSHTESCCLGQCRYRRWHTERSRTHEYSPRSCGHRNQPRTDMRMWPAAARQYTFRRSGTGARHIHQRLSCSWSHAIQPNTHTGKSLSQQAHALTTRDKSRRLGMAAMHIRQYRLST